MNIPLWICIAIPILVGAAPITQGRGHRIDEKQLARYVHKRGLPLPPELRRPVLDRIGSQERGVLWWTGGLFLAGIVAALVVEWVTGNTNFSGILILLPPAFGVGVGSYLGLRRARPHLVADAPRVARPKAMDVRDYTTRPEDLAVRLAAIVVATAGLFTLLVWALVPIKPGGGFWVPVILALVMGGVLGLLALFRKAETDLVERPQHAASELELAWDDSTRADTIRALRDNSMVLALITVLGLMIVSGSWVIGPEVRGAGPGLTMALGLAAFVVGCISWIILLVPWVVGRSRRNPALGLWSGKFGVA